MFFTGGTLSGTNVGGNERLRITNTSGPLSGNVGIGISTPTSTLHLSGSYGTTTPITTATSIALYAYSPYTSLIFSGATTVTLPTASTTPGRWLYLKTTAAATINSATSNITPLTGTVPNNVILPQTTPAQAGRWANLQSDGTNWVVMAAG